MWPKCLNLFEKRGKRSEIAIACKTVISRERFGPYMTRVSIVAIVALVLLSAMAMPVQAQEEESVE